MKGFTTQRFPVETLAKYLPGGTRPPPDAAPLNNHIPFSS
jgi:hypothetical protein